MSDDRYFDDFYHLDNSFDNFAGKKGQPATLIPRKPSNENDKSKNKRTPRKPTPEPLKLEPSFDHDRFVQKQGVSHP